MVTIPLDSVAGGFHIARRPAINLEKQGEEGGQTRIEAAEVLNGPHGFKMSLFRSESLGLHNFGLDGSH